MVLMQIDFLEVVQIPGRPAPKHCSVELLIGLSYLGMLRRVTIRNIEYAGAIAYLGLPAGIKVAENRGGARHDRMIAS